MDEEHLEDMYRMVRENNSVLRGMRRSALIHGFFKFVFWAIILFVLYLGWTSYVQPTLDRASQTYQNAQTQVQSAQKSLQGVQEAASSTQSFFGGILKNFGF